MNVAHIYYLFNSSCKLDCYHLLLARGFVILVSHLQSFTLTGKQSEVETKLEQANAKPGVDVQLTDLKLLLGPELRIVYPLILNFAVSGELELNGMAHPKWIKPRGILTFENGEVNLVATQVRPLFTC